jgi:hypothetical protein
MSASAIIQKTFKHLKRCSVSRCRGTVRKSEHSDKCARHRYRAFRDKFPDKCAFNNLRKRAHERGHAFILSFSKFKELWDEGLAKNHGRGAGFLSIDRIRNEEGYSDDNVRLLTYSENSRKQFVEFFRRQTENIAYVPTESEISEIEKKLAVDF